MAQSPPPNRRTQLTERLQYLGQMSSTETALFHHAAAVKEGLTITDSKTLSALMQEGPMTAGQLAGRLCLTSGAVTSVIDRLEKARCVHRVADPADRRKVVVQVDKTQLKRMSAPYESMRSAFEKLLAQYSDEQLDFLVSYYEAIVEMTRGQITQLSDQG